MLEDIGRQRPNVFRREAIEELSVPSGIRLEVLVVPAESPRTRALMSVVHNAGFAPVPQHTPAGALQYIESHKPSAVLLVDDTPPASSAGAMELLRSIRATGSIPIVMVRAEDGSDGTVTVLTSGADDYVHGIPTRPEDSVAGPLIARLDRAIRVAAMCPNRLGEVLEFGDVRIHVDTRRAYLGEQEIQLTLTEYKLLAAFMRNPETVLAPADLVAQVWGRRHANRVHYARVYVHRLRKLFDLSGPSGPRIETRRGLGYCLTA